MLFRPPQVSPEQAQHHIWRHRRTKLLKFGEAPSSALIVPISSPATGNEVVSTGDEPRVKTHDQGVLILPLEVLLQKVEDEGLAASPRAGNATITTPVALSVPGFTTAEASRSINLERSNLSSLLV